MTFDAPSAEPLSLSILVCTHNRSISAARLLAVLLPQMKALPVELILVDSASEAHHQNALSAVVRSHAGASLRLLRLEEQGISNARNTGLDAARAEWVSYIDDDEVPSPGWLTNALELIRRLPPDCAACGGVVRPDFGPHGDPTVTESLGKRWRTFLGEIMADGEFDQTEQPKFGVGHCLLRVEAIRQVGGFDSKLGRDGKSLLSGEEVLLLEQLTARGWHIWHSSRISVLHDIEPERLKKPWAIKRSYWEGVSRARIRRLNGSRNALAAASAAAKMLPLAVMAPFMAADYELDLRLAFNWGFVTETLGQLFSGSRMALLAMLHPTSQSERAPPPPA